MKTVKVQVEEKYGRTPNRGIEIIDGYVEAMDDYPEDYVEKGDRISAYSFDLEEVEKFEIYKDGVLWKEYDPNGIF